MKTRQPRIRPNPHLREAFLEVVENQLEANDPPETRETLVRLMEDGMNEADARAHIAAVVAVETYAVMKSQDVFNRERFVRNLRALPEEPKL